MEALIENGEEWMEPLMELRELLVTSRSSEEYREKRRRDGTEKTGFLGPYKPWFRAFFLENLFIAQKEIQQTQPNIALISYQELAAIQVTWYRDNIFNYNVADIYNKVFGTNIVLYVGDDNLVREKELLKESCKGNPEDFELINDLLALQKTKTILMNNRGLQNVLENRLEQFAHGKMG
jgi:DNA sulfur modification protein DndC